MIQNSPEWLEMRKGKIGASDANIIMGVSKYMTSLDLYLEKKGLPPRRKISDNEFILSKGHYLEEKIRAEIELETGCDFPPYICVHNQIDYLMASMDGFNDQWQMATEFKYVGQDVFSEISAWNPESNKPFPAPQFYPQIQQQYLCSGAKKVAVVAITEKVEMVQKECIGGPEPFIMVPKKVDNKLVYILNENGKRTYKKVLKVVPLDMDYINFKLLPALINFQKNHIEINVEPTAGESDIIEIKNLEVGKKVTEYKKNKEKMNVLEIKLKPLKVIEKSLKIEIFKMELVNADNMVCKNIYLSQGTKKGKIDYESAFNSIKTNVEMVFLSFDNYETMADISRALESAVGLDPENFRASSSDTYKITIEKKKEDKKEKVGNVVDEYLEAKTTTKITEIETIGDISKTTITETSTETLKTKKDDWENMSESEQNLQSESNAFKTDKGKKPNGWDNKSRPERITYLLKLANRKESSNILKKTASELAEKLNQLN